MLFLWENNFEVLFFFYQFFHFVMFYCNHFTVYLSLNSLIQQNFWSKIKKMYDIFKWNVSSGRTYLFLIYHTVNVNNLVTQAENN